MICDVRDVAFMAEWAPCALIDATGAEVPGFIVWADTDTGEVHTAPDAVVVKTTYPAPLTIKRLPKMLNCGEEYWLRQPLMAAFEAKLGEKRDLAFDIGANKGTWTVPMSMAFKKVVAVEPDDRASNQILSNCPTAVIVRKAASRYDGVVTFCFREESVYNSTLAEHPIGGGGGKHVPSVEEREVESVCLDSLAVEHGTPDFVKIDIEGGEVDALKGADEADWTDTVFLVECHDTYPAVEAELQRLGHDVTRIPHPFGAHPGHCWALGVYPEPAA